MLFKEYVNRDKTMSKKRLRLLMHSLEKDGLRTEDFTHEDKPYIFVYAYPVPTTFEGVRFCMHGDILAFQTSKKPDTQPYGVAYELDLQTMVIDIFNNEENRTEKHITNMLLQLIGREMRDHFKKAKAAEQDILTGQVGDGKSASGQIVIRNNGTDYANTVLSKWN